MIWLLFLIAGQADGPRLDCKHPDTQYAMNMCAGRYAARADVAMNRQWAKTKAVMVARDAESKDMRPDGDPSYLKTLLESQRAWLAFRDAECKLESYSMRGGSAQSLEFADCMGKLTTERTLRLAQLAKDL